MTQPNEDQQRAAVQGATTWTDGRRRSVRLLSASATATAAASVSNVETSPVNAARTTGQTGAGTVGRTNSSSDGEENPNLGYASRPAGQEEGAGAKTNEITVTRATSDTSRPAPSATTADDAVSTNSGADRGARSSSAPAAGTINLVRRSRSQRRPDVAHPTPRTVTCPVCEERITEQRGAHASWHIRMFRHLKRCCGEAIRQGESPSHIRDAIAQHGIAMCTEPGCHALVSTTAIRHNLAYHLRREHQVTQPFVGRRISAEMTRVIGDYEELAALTPGDAEWPAKTVTPNLLWRSDDTLSLFAKALILMSQLLAADATAVRGHGATLFAIFPKCVLRSNRKGFTPQHELRARLSKWLEGKWPELLSQANEVLAQIVDNRRQRRNNASTRPTNALSLPQIKQAADAIKRGYPGQALDVLNRTGLVPNAQEALQTKWPTTDPRTRQASQDNTDAAAGQRARTTPDHATIKLTPNVVLQQMQRMARKTSTDVYGWNAKHILAVWRDSRPNAIHQASPETRKLCDQARTEWLHAVDQIAENQMLNSTVGNDLFRAGVVIPLRKKPDSSDVRPIVVTPMLRRIVCGALQRQYRKVAVQKVECPCDNVKQLALSTNGLDKLAKIVTMLQETQADTAIVLQVDIANAYNTIRRDSTVQAMADCVPETGPLMRCLYPAETRGTYTDNQGVKHNIQTDRGVYQGCPLSTTAFCAAFNTVLKPVGRAHPNVQFLAYADDLHLVGSPDEVKAAFDDFLARAFHTLDLCVNPQKCRVWAPTPGLAQNATVSRLRVTVVTDGLEVVGVPIGTVDFQRHMCTDKLHAIQQRMKNLKCLATGREHDGVTPAVHNASQLALRVIWQSACATMGHLQRNVAPAVLAPITVQFDRWIKDTFAYHVCPVEDDRWPLLTLPFRMGGLALVSTYATRQAAYLGSWAAALLDSNIAWSTGSDTTAIHVTSVTVKSPLRDWYPQWNHYFDNDIQDDAPPGLKALRDAASHYNQVKFKKWDAALQQVTTSDNSSWTDWWNEAKPTLPLSSQTRTQSLHTILREAAMEAQSLWIQGEYDKSPLAKPGQSPFWQATPWLATTVLDKPGMALLHERRRKGGLLTFTALQTHAARMIFNEELIAHTQVMFGLRLVSAATAEAGCQARSQNNDICGKAMYKNGRHAVNCNQVAACYIRHETAVRYMLDMAEKYTKMGYSNHELLRQGEVRVYRADAEFIIPGSNRDVVADATVVDPAVRALPEPERARRGPDPPAACIGLSVAAYKSKHPPGQECKCGEGAAHRRAQGPAAVAARIAEQEKRALYGRDPDLIRRNAWGNPTPLGMEFVPFAAQLTGSLGPDAEAWLDRCAQAAARRGPHVSYRERKRRQALYLKQMHEAWLFRLPGLHWQLMSKYNKACHDTFSGHRRSRPRRTRARAPQPQEPDAGQPRNGNNTQQRPLSPNRFESATSSSSSGRSSTTRRGRRATGTVSSATDSAETISDSSAESTTQPEAAANPATSPPPQRRRRGTQRPPRRSQRTRRPLLQEPDPRNNTTGPRTSTTQRTGTRSRTCPPPRTAAPL